jgi:hypothetical protein
LRKIENLEFFEIKMMEENERTNGTTIDQKKISRLLGQAH